MRFDKLSKNELEARLNELRLELMKLEAKARIKALKQTGKIRQIRKDIAKILTLLKLKG